MRKTIESVTAARPGWGRAVFAASVLALGGIAVARLTLSPGETSTAFAVAVCVLLVGLAVRIWIGPVFNDEAAGEDDPA